MNYNNYLQSNNDDLFNIIKTVDLLSDFPENIIEPCQYDFYLEDETVISKNICTDLSTINFESVTSISIPEGNVTKIACGDTIVWQQVTKHTITYSIKNASLSSTATSVNSGTSYTTTITTNNGYEAIVSVTMNGEDITSDVYDGNFNISIPSVTGDVSITVSEKIINLLPLATDTDRTTIYNGIGYMSGKRLSSSGGGIVTASGMCASGFIPAKVDDVLRIQNTKPKTGTASYIMTFNSSNTKVGVQSIYQVSGDWATVAGKMTYENGVLIVPLTSANFGSGFDSIRFSAGTIDDTTMVTINQEI